MCITAPKRGQRQAPMRPNPKLQPNLKRHRRKKRFSVLRDNIARGYVLLETVVATGLLVLGLSVIGAQVQDSTTAIRKMELKMRAMSLAQMQMAMLDLGLIELDSVDEEQDGDFGPRYPDWGWLLTTEETAVEGLYQLTLDVLYHIREDEYQEDDFELDAADRIFTAYAFRSAPQALDFARDFGLDEEELEKLNKRLEDVSIPGLDLSSFDPTLLATVDIEELLQVLPVLMDAFGFEFDDVASMLPPEILQQIKDSGLFEFGNEEDQENSGNNNENNNDNNNGESNP